MSPNLAEQQLDAIPWTKLRAGGGSAEDVAGYLRQLLFSSDADVVRQAYRSIENPVTAQGHLFPCAPAVVSVIAAGLADASISRANLAPALDLVGLVVGSEADASEVALGWGDLRARCQRELLRSYWSLVRVASTPDQDEASKVAADLLELLLEDQPHHPFD